MRFLHITSRRAILYILDIITSGSAIYFAYLLRWDGDIPGDQWEVLLSLLPFVIACRTASFVYFGFYSRFWEYSSLEDLLLIIKSVIIGSFLIIFITFIYNRSFLIPRSIIIVDMLLLVMLLGGSRMLWRLWRERQQTTDENDLDKTRVLILGAEDTGAKLLKYIRQFSPNYLVMGFIDDNPKLKNSNIMGIQVLGTYNDIPELTHLLEIKEVLVATRNVSSDKLGQLVEICKTSGVKYKMITSVLDLSTHEIHISKIKNIEINDLLGRDLVSIDLSSIKQMVHGKRVLVTGAGGSIGSELCSHILEYQPESLVMLDIGENYLYELKMTLTPEAKNTKTYYLFCSVTNKNKMEAIFDHHRPELVFHAAAHKHVPLMEENADEAIYNNIYGTKITADVSSQFGVDKFVMVSTDKVVKPTSIMGMTKKVAEKYIRHMAGQSITQFITVRFGNVLGSNGSIVPLFQKQIEKGGPVTITHPEMNRFFMLIPEAVQLILQAGAFGSGGDIFMLEMGKPVKIVDLAEQMIRLAGYTPNTEIEIKFIGIRPGEKLSEELIDDGENIFPTPHEKIKLLKSHEIPSNDFMKKIDALCQKASHLEPLKLRHALFELTIINLPKPQEKLKTQSSNRKKGNN